MLELRLPRLTMAMESATVVAWAVDDGDRVVARQPVVSVETEKSVEDLEAPGDGAIRLHCKPGEVIEVDGLLASIESETDAERTLAPVARPAAAPAARAFARANGVDLDTIDGSGPGGRIVRGDVEKVLAVREAGPGATREPTGGSLRQAVVANLAASWHEIPHINIIGELDATGLVQALALSRRCTDGAKVTMTDLVILAVADAIRHTPEVNAVGGTPSDKLNLAIAVESPAGVVAPVLRDVAARSLAGIASERHRLVTAAREGSLRGDDLAAATCTISNLGTYHVDLFTPVITGPQAALITLGRVRRVPVVEGDRVCIGDRVWVDVALDHRTADGAVGGRLLDALAEAFRTLPDRVSSQLRWQP